MWLSLLAWLELMGHLRRTRPLEGVADSGLLECQARPGGTPEQNRGRLGADRAAAGGQPAQGALGALVQRKGCPDLLPRPGPFR